MVTIGNDWDEILREEFEKPYYLELRKFLKTEYQTQKIHPDMYDIFNSIRFTAFEDVKVVLLGQDPYHGKNQAHGLAFSVKKGVSPPPSLVNMFKELKLENPPHGCLENWAKQGVLLLNTVLTVREGEAFSHRNKGWEIFTDNIIKRLNDREKPIVFLLWGNSAQSKQSIITNSHHYILKTVHPSPLSASRGFFGCGHFEKANSILEGLGISPIDWHTI